MFDNATRKINIFRSDLANLTCRVNLTEMNVYINEY